MKNTLHWLTPLLSSNNSLSPLTHASHSGKLPFKYLRIRHITHLSHAEEDHNQCAIAQHAHNKDKRK